jgi:hypothetical protein
MNGDLCKICGELKFDYKPHSCGTEYTIKGEEVEDYYGEEGTTVYAFNFDLAADKFAKEYNEATEYSLMGESIEIVVSDGKKRKKV